MAVDLPPSHDLDNVPKELLEIMRVMRQSIEATFNVDSKYSSFTRLGALMAVGGVTPGSVRGHLGHLLDQGVTREEIWGAMYSIIGHIGMPRFVSMLPVLEAELGLPDWGSPS